MPCLPLLTTLRPLLPTACPYTCAPHFSSSPAPLPLTSHAWAAWYNTWLLVKLTPQGVVFSLLFLSPLYLPLVPDLSASTAPLPLTSPLHLPLCLLPLPFTCTCVPCLSPSSAPSPLPFVLDPQPKLTIVNRPSIFCTVNCCYSAPERNGHAWLSGVLLLHDMPGQPLSVEAC